jgi:hypothetical protein
VNDYDEIRKKMAQMIIENKENWEIIVGASITISNYREVSSGRVMYGEGFSIELKNEIERVLWNNRRADNSDYNDSYRRFPRSRQQNGRNGERFSNNDNAGGEQQSHHNESNEREGGEETSSKYKPNAEEEWKEILKRYKNHYNDDIDRPISKGEIGDEIIAKLRAEKVFDWEDLDSSLWSPHKSWAEKLVSLKENSEIENFKNQMFSAIEEAAKKKKQQNSNNDSDRRDKENTPTDNNKNKPDKKDSPASSPSNSDQEKALIENLKREIETLKANQNRTAVQEVELSKKEQKLRELEKDNSKSSKSQNSNLDNNFPTGWVIGGAFLLVLVGGIITLLVIRNRKKKKKISH